MKQNNYGKLIKILAILAILFLFAIYLWVMGRVFVLQAAEIPPPPPYPFETQIIPHNADIQLEILRILNYIHSISHHIWYTNALNLQELQDTHIRLVLTHYTLLDQQEIMQVQQESIRITQMWSIALTAFSAGLLLVVIFAIVWSKSTC